MQTANKHVIRKCSSGLKKRQERSLECKMLIVAEMRQGKRVEQWGEEEKGEGV